MTSQLLCGKQDKLIIYNALLRLTIILTLKRIDYQFVIPSHKVDEYNVPLKLEKKTA